jgi:regulator of protease activity HflC (stomatin/prohibitin superfamily)
MVREVEVKTANGLPVLIGALLGLIVPIGLYVWAGQVATHSFDPSPVFIGLLVVVGAAIQLTSFLTLFGLMNIGPNEARVLQLFGEYKGTAKTDGLRFTNPFYTKTKISLRVRNFESQKLKVNDRDGSPIEIAAIVVWRVTDTAEAMFEVDNYVDYVNVQSEAALRNLATQHPYDDHTEVDHAVAAANIAGETGSTLSADAKVGAVYSLRGSTAQIAEELKREIRERLAKAGVEVIEARISHLAYAPEIAGAMLRRQQAGAIIAARQKIVEGAVGMVEMALTMLSEKKVIEMDDERKAAMVSNLLVVLCGETEAQPVVNAGSLYQ